MPHIDPMVVGIWCGESKPHLNEYFNPLITELKSILLNGVIVNSQVMAIKMGKIICDTPARAFAKGKLI